MLAPPAPVSWISPSPVSSLATQSCVQRLQRSLGNQALMRLLGPSTGKEKTDSSSSAEPLAINEPGDSFEREADAVADQVMRTPAAATTGAGKSFSSGDDGNQLQRKCAHCEEKEESQKKLQRKAVETTAPVSVQRKCSQCEEEEEQKKVQRSETGAGPAVAPSSLTYVTITLSATVGVPITPDSNSVAGILAKRVRRDRYNRRWGGHKESKQN